MTYRVHEYANYFDLCMNESSTIDELWVQFKAHVRHCIVHFIPTVRKRTKKQNPWITHDAIHLKHKIKCITKSNKTCMIPDYHTHFNSLTQSLKSNVKEHKQHYCSTTLDGFIKTSPHKFWWYISSQWSYSTAGSTKIDADSNSHFQSVFMHDNGSSRLSTLGSACENTLIDSPTISKAGVLTPLLNIDEKKCYGPDGIPNMFLKWFAEPISNYLCLIYKKSLDGCRLPAQWKVAKIIPVHKSGNVSSATNYGPISLTCTCCKLLKHIILKFMTNFVEANKILHRNKHWFLSGFSTATQLIEIIHDIAQCLNIQSQTDTVFLDLSKAFDRVSLVKLRFNLINIFGEGPLIQWIYNYHCDRYQFVQYDHRILQLVRILSGVPQGAVLAPLLFLLCINDIPNEPDVKIQLFADDCMLYTEIQDASDHERLSNASGEIGEWCNKWQITISLGKTVSMSIRKKSELDYVYSLNNTNIWSVTEYRYLGVLITFDLNWMWLCMSRA